MNRARSILCCALVLAAACRTATVVPVATPVAQSPHVDKPQLKVALMAASSGESGPSAQHAVQGARLAFDQANADGTLSVDVIGVASDTEQNADVASATIARLAEDPSVIGIIAWPSPAEASVIISGAAASGLPLISVSPVGSQGGSTKGTSWSRMVASDRDQAAVLSAYIARVLEPRRACVIGDDGLRSLALMRWIRADLGRKGVAVPLVKAVPGEQPDYPSLATAVSDAGCEAVFWGGGGGGGGALRAELSVVDPQEVTLVGVDSLIGEQFVNYAGSSGEGTVASCPCPDVSTRTGLDAQRFIQDYQFKYGSPPAPYSVAGWDAAQRFLGALSAGDTDRESVMSFLDHQTSYDGLGGNYLFDSMGASPSTKIFLYEEIEDGWLFRGAKDAAIASAQERLSPKG